MSEATQLSSVTREGFPDWLEQPDDRFEFDGREIGIEVPIGVVYEDVALG